MKSLFVAVLAAVQITGAGATFPYPFYSKAFTSYSASHPGVTIKYNAVGSGTGIADFTGKSVDFGASDVPLNSEELKRAEAGGGTVIEVPTTLGGVAITYNLTGLPRGIRLTREILADIYLGKITTWNDPAIARLNVQENNPLPLPNLPIVVVHRSDASGTTYHFTDFLSRVSPEWKAKAGTAKSVAWPSNRQMGGEFNDGVAAAVSKTPGAIGYVELAYAIEHTLAQATLQNRAGTWLTCTAAGISAAAATKTSISPSDFSIVDSSASNAWPIAAFSWAIVYERPADRIRGRAVRDVLDWLVGDAQPIASSLNYVPLPPSIAKYAKTQLKKMNV